MELNQLAAQMEQYKQNGGDLGELMRACQALCATGTTPNIGLNQWQLSDKPTMEDFNRDNGIIDGEIARIDREKANYRIGDWTPTMAGETTPGSFSYTLQAGKYIKAGELCFFQGAVTGTITSKGAGHMIIRGLPFSNRASSYSPWNIYSLYAVSSLSGGSLYAYTRPGQNFIVMSQQFTDRSYSMTEFSNPQFDVGKDFSFTFSGCFYGS